MPDVSSQNASPVINIVAWFLLTTSILSVLTRVARKYAVVRRLMADDYLIVAALVRYLSSSWTILMTFQRPLRFSIVSAYRSRRQTAMGNQQ